MFSAVDPIPMVQLINLLGISMSYGINLLRYPSSVGKCRFICRIYIHKEELEQIIEQVERENEIEIIKTTQLTNKSKTTVLHEVRKTIYIAGKAYYKMKKGESQAIKLSLLFNLLERSVYSFNQR
jgi:hypothetical protein